MDNISEKLGILGLDDKETTIYMAILSLGKGTITDISRKTAIKRTTVYGYLEKLLRLGLILKTAYKKRTFYSSGDPRNIKNILEKQKTEIDEKKAEISSIIPDLEALLSSGLKRPQISYYEGREGIREVYWQIFATHKTIYSIFSPDNFFELFSETENHKLLMTLYNNGGMLESLVEKTKQPRVELKRPEYQKFIKSKELPKGFSFETDLLVAGDTIALISFKNLIGVIIQDHAIAELQKNFIKTIWKMPTTKVSLEKDSLEQKKLVLSR